MASYTYSFDSDFEFEAKMPEELLVKAMHSTRPLFITDEFLARIAQTSPDQVVRELVTDLHRESAPDDADDLLRWFYLFMDFESDFPRLMAMQQLKEETASEQ
jgi:hypothetical protein